MDDLTRAGFVAHARSPAFRRRVFATIELLIAQLDRRSYVSFSAGKDSSVVADLCHRHQPGIPMLMVDPGCPTHWLEAERAQWLAFAAERGWNLILFPWDKWRAVESAASDAEHRRLAHDSMFADLTAWADERGLEQRVVGLRAEESRGRAIHLRGRGPQGTNADGRRWLAPLASWRTDDVWAWIVTHDLPWLSIYDHLGARARNGLIGRSGVNRGRMAWLKIHYPAAYAEAKRLMPLEAQYA